MTADDGEVRRGGRAMGVIIEVGKGGTSDEVVDCGSLVFPVGKPRRMMGVGDVCELRGISRGAGGGRPGCIY
jgi:hypothetical protein